MLHEKNVDVGHVESSHTSQDSCQSEGGAGNNLQTLAKK